MLNLSIPRRQTSDLVLTNPAEIVYAGFICIEYRVYFIEPLIQPESFIYWSFSSHSALFICKIYVGKAIYFLQKLS